VLIGSTVVLGRGLTISGYFFIGIASAALLREVASHDDDWGKLTAASLFGVGLPVVKPPRTFART